MNAALRLGGLTTAIPKSSFASYRLSADLGGKPWRGSTATTRRAKRPTRDTSRTTLVQGGVLVTTIKIAQGHRESLRGSRRTCFEGVGVPLLPRCAPGASSCALARSEGLIEQTCQSRLALHELFVGRTIILVAALPIANGFFGTQLATFFAQEIRHGSP